MREILIGKGIPPNVILCEEKSTTTLENIEFTLPILREHAINHVMIVTDATHAPRAAMVARHFGLKAKVSSPSWRGARKRTVLRQVIREAVALPIYALRLRRIPRTGPMGSD